MAKDYYVILGIGDDASLDEIKSAYRREAKKRHPDHSGAGSEPFLDLQEAYEVLCDPGRRRAYDDGRARGEQRSQSAGRAPRPEPIHQRRPPAEPLVPSRRYGGAADPSFESPLSSLMAELLGQAPGAPGRRRGAPGTQEAHLDVLVSREEAEHGGRVRVWVPVAVACPACRGRGATPFFPCQHCLGQGKTLEERALDIAFHGDVTNGSRGQVSLRRPGLPDLSLVLRFHIDPRS